MSAWSHCMTQSDVLTVREHIRDAGWDPASFRQLHAGEYLMNVLSALRARGEHQLANQIAADFDTAAMEDALFPVR